MKMYLIAAVLIGGIVWGIDHNGYSRCEAKYELQISNTKTKQTEELREAERKGNAKVAVQAKNVERLSAQLITANTKIDAQERRLRERKHNVSTSYRPQPTAALISVPGWIVTNGWLCDYNRAIGYDVSGTGAGISRTESAACAADPFGRSTITGERILGHHEEYGSYCRKLEEQVNGLIDYAESIEADSKSDGGRDAGSR